MVADIKKAPRERARKIQWWRIRKFCHTGSKIAFTEREGASNLKNFSPN